MKMKKSRILAALLALAMCVALAACGKTNPPPAPPTDGDTAATLKLGFIGPLTGGAALYGQAAERGAKIAVDEIKAAGGDLAIEWNPQDDEHDAEKAVNAYGQLKDWGVQAIIGCVTSTPCNAVAAEAFADRVFMLSPSASSTTVLEGRDNVYQICFTDPNQGSASAQYITDNALATKVAVIYNNSDAYSTGIYQTFVEKAAELGLEVVSETAFPADDTTDFTVQLKDAKDKGAELVFLPIYYTPASLILKQAADMQYTPKFFGCDGLDGILSMEGFDTALAEGLMLLTPFSADAEDQMTKDFVAKYQELYGEIPSQFAADGYDCVYAMYQAITAAGVDVSTATAADICEAMIATFSSETFSVDGLTGQGMTWSTTGEVSKAPKAVVIQEGVYVGM